MPRGSAVGDNRAASHERLEAGHPAGGVNEHVGGREQFAHLVAEPEDANSHLPGERLGELRPERLVSPAETDNERGRQLQACAHGAREIPHPPAAAGDDDDGCVERQDQLAPCLLAGTRLEERARDERPDATGAPDPGYPLDRRDAGGVHDEVEVDPGVSPELEPGKIGGRRARGHRQAAAASQMAEHARCRRKGRDDDVRPVALDQPEQRSRAEERKARAPESAERGNTSEEAVKEAEDPGGEAQLPAVGVEQDEAKQSAESNQRVADHHLDVSSLADELGRECPRRSRVTLPDLGGEDDDPTFRRARRRAGG